MAKQKESDALKINKLTAWKLAAAILGLLLVISIFTGGFRGSSTDSAATNDAAKAVPAQEAQPAQQRQADTAQKVDMTALADDDAVLGDPNAPVTIVEWSDFECPFCGRFHNDAYQQIKSQYIDTGKVKFVYRDFPLGFHANAQKAAETAECAGEQGKFWDMHDLLFGEGVSGGVASFKGYAADLGLDTEKFNTCLDSGETVDEIKKDLADGTAVGITGTPGFVINGQLVVGAQPFSVFQQVIEGELAK